ncbi:hypothetical protein Tco_0617890 [Tanacetum coccineum]
MGDVNPIYTFEDYSKPSHEGYRYTIDLPEGNNVVPLRFDTIRLVENGCSFNILRSEDPNQHLKDFLKLENSLDLNGEDRERTRLRLFQFSLRDQASNWLEHFIKLVKAISTPQSTSKTLNRRLLELEDKINFLLKGSRPTPRPSSRQVPQAYAEADYSNPRLQNQNEPPKQNPFTFRERTGPNPQPQVLETTFEARVRDYMAAHAKRMERFENAIFKHREVINDRMTKMFELLKELSANQTPKKVLIREEARHPITKNVNSISDIREEEEKDVVNNRAIIESIVEPSKSEEEEPPKKASVTNEVERRADDEPTKIGACFYEAILKKKITKNEDIGGNFEIPCNIGGLKHTNTLVNQGYDVNVMPFFTYSKLTNERPAETDIRLSLANIKEDEKRPFILGTPFLTTAKAVIKFDKGTVTLRSGKSKINFHRIPESLCKVEKGIRNDIEPVAPTMTAIFDEKKLGSS